MKRVRKLSENEVVGEFLKTEINSNRWKGRISKLLSSKNSNRSVIENTDYDNKAENIIRADILSKFRGWKQNKLLFTNFPKDVKWYEYELENSDIKKIYYMDYSYWNELSGKTRLVIIGARNAKKGLKIFGKSNKQFERAAQFIEKGGKFPKLILLAKDKYSKLVLLEGHLRATALLWNKDILPNKLRVIIGFSESMGAWTKFED